MHAAAVVARGTSRNGRRSTIRIPRRNSAVPAVSAGTAVSVKTAAGVLIVRGSF